MVARLADANAEHNAQYPATPRVQEDNGFQLSETPSSPRRLDSWKAIATYLQRDVATVARWEKGLGLPVRRVGGGGGRSVFAYTSEIDDWLQSNRSSLDRGAPPLPAPVPNARSRSWSWPILSAAVLALVVALLLRPRPIAADDLRVELTAEGLLARDSSGQDLWRHEFPATHKTFLPLLANGPVQVMGGATPGVYFATGYRTNQKGDAVQGGELTLLDFEGRSQRSFTFDDQVTFQGTSYATPWAISGFDLTESPRPRRVAVAAHHYSWDPGLVTVLDEHWQRRGTFVHAGWIEQVRWLGANRLVIGGFSNAHNGGMLALLDPDALDGQGPELEGSVHHCETCGSDRPLRMFVFPRSEINRVSAARFNRVVLQTGADRVFARTVEMPLADGDAVVVYEFTAALDFVSARFGERYWDMHKTLENEGRLTHSRAQCPDRDGPRQIQSWEPKEGWRTVQIR